MPTDEHSAFPVSFARNEMMPHRRTPPTVWQGRGRGSTRRRNNTLPSSEESSERLPQLPHPPLPVPKNLNVHTKQANRSAAGVFKHLLEDEEEGSYNSQADAAASIMGLSRPMHLPPTISAANPIEDVVARQYPVVPRRQLRTIAHAGEDIDQLKEWRSQSNHLLVGQKYPSASNQQNRDNAAAAFLRSPETRSRAATESSDDVVHQTALYITDAGCDLPMPRLNEDGKVQQLPVRLDPDLPPMAVEHPTRVWNSLIHSMAPELQPLIKWEYDEMELETYGEVSWIAHMTLILPPTHPSVVNHPLFHVLPLNRYSAEYIKAIEALGGMKTWTGEPRKLKAEAQNTALSLCISQDGLSWVLAPVMAPIPMDEDDSFQSATAISKSVPDSLLLRPGGDLESATHVSPTLASLAKELNRFDTDSNIMLVVQFEQCLDTGLYGCKLTARRGSDVKHYEEPCNHLTSYGASETVCWRAINHNILGFFLSPEDQSGDPSGMPCKSDHILVESSLDNASEGAGIKRTVATSEVNGIDWITKLKNFCATSGLPQPKFGQRIQQRTGLPTLFFGTVTVEDESFEASEPRRALKAARLEVARKVFVDHFGQDPVEI